VSTNPLATRARLAWLAGGASIALVISALVAPTATVAQVQSDNGDITPSITVSGTGRVKAEPDVADINLGVLEKLIKLGVSTLKKRAAEKQWPVSAR